MPQDRGICCHVGGQIDFDYDGQPVPVDGRRHEPVLQSAGYTPIDDRATRNPAFDARRTSGNTNDLRGKILRIRVTRRRRLLRSRTANMFGRNQARTRPEIYAMGIRNPFRFAVNRRNGDVYVGDYSPDANMADPARGPAGQGRWMLVRRPANYGWPFCATPDKPYVDYDFTPSAPQSGEEFNCFRPTNDSAQQHRPAAGCRRSCGRRSGTATRPATRACSRSCSTCAAATGSGRWAARRTSSTPRTARRSGSRACSTATRCSMSGRATTSRCSS